MPSRIKSYYRFMAIILLLALMIPAPLACRGFDVPVIRSSHGTSPHTTIQSDEFDEATSREETMKVVKKAADAISHGNKKALMNELDESTVYQLDGDLDLSVPGAKLLADGLRNAKAVEVHPYIVFYEMTIQSETWSFYVSNEEGEWKIGGL
jgi:hypothetical protein